ELAAPRKPAVRGLVEEENVAAIPLLGHRGDKRREKRAVGYDVRQQVGRALWRPADLREWYRRGPVAVRSVRQRMRDRHEGMGGRGSGEDHPHDVDRVDVGA